MGIPASRIHEANKTVVKIAVKVTQFLNRFWTVVPRHYSEKFRSPCWYANQSTVRELNTTFQLQQHSDELITTKHFRYDLLAEIKLSSERKMTLLCLPSFFLAGFSKCGTTTVNLILNRMEGIVPAEMKEIHWWGSGPLGLEGRSPEFYHHAVTVYLLNFLSASHRVESHKGSLTFDASPSTLVRSPFVLDNQEYCAIPAIMSRVLPNAKFIVLLRNPVERVYSHFFQMCTSSRGPGTNITNWPKDVRVNPAGFFHQEVVTDVSYFNECLMQHSSFECINAMKKRRSGCESVTYKLTMGLYYIHIKKWLQFYSREQFLFLRLEDLSREPHTFLSQITNFLGTYSVSQKVAKKLSSIHSNRKKISEARTDVELMMRKESKELLENFYRPYNRLLVEFIGDKRFLWDY